MLRLIKMGLVYSHQSLDAKLIAEVGMYVGD